MTGIRLRIVKQERIVVNHQLYGRNMVQKKKSQMPMIGHAWHRKNISH